MAITPKLEIRQSQSLLMTPQLRQAINLLQLSNLELNQLLEQELVNNPLLEREDDRLADTSAEDISPLDEFNRLDQNLPVENEEFSPDLDYDNQFNDDAGSDRESYDLSSDVSWEQYNPAKNSGTADADFDYFEQKLAAEKSLTALIEEQISLRFTNPREKLIARLLAEQLDGAGYFRGSLENTAKALGTTVETVEKILRAMQGFEPSGIFARSLAETLAIQLRDRNRYDPVIACLLEHLDLVAARNFKEIKRLCNIDDDDLASVLADIKSLDPKPATRYTVETAAAVVPDVLVSRRKDGSYHIELNSLSLPRLLINHTYYAEVMAGAGHDKAASRYLKENLRHAGFLIKSLHQRASTILRVAEAIVKYQRDFFEYGIEQLKPMSLKDIAYDLELHESTVSRVTSHKYMQTPRGLFELKYFFSAAANTYTGNDNTSTTSIKHQIKQLINAETPEAVLSDDKIVELLAAQGIKIARRTVAKYREAMNIPTSAERKRLKRSL